MPDQIPNSLKGLRVRLVAGSENSTPIEQRAYIKLKKLLSEHGQHLSERVLSQFRQSLNGLLLHGLRARPVESADGSRIRFIGSDERHYTAPAEKWSAVQKADPGAKKYVAGEAGASKETSSQSEQPKKRSLADSLFDQALSRLGKQVNWQTYFANARIRDNTTSSGRLSWFGKNCGGTPRNDSPVFGQI
jgi:hypothetical protein